MVQVSVIIPTYNCAQYACQAVESVLAQTFKDYEIVVAAFANRFRVASPRAYIGYVLDQPGSLSRRFGGRYLDPQSHQPLWMER